MEHLGSGRHLGAFNPAKYKRTPRYAYLLARPRLSPDSKTVPLCVRICLCLSSSRTKAFRSFLLPKTVLDSKLQAGANIIDVVVIAWWIAVILISIFSCNPIRDFWDHTIKSKCINTELIFIGNAVPTIVMDVIIWHLHIRTIWDLQTSR